MKKVKQLSAAPPSLSDFLKNYPHTTRRTSDWKVFDGQAKKNLLQALYEVQHGLCAYCEISLTVSSNGTSIDDRQIEHFHPKSDIPHATDWMFELSNLFAACLGGESKTLFGKGSKFKDEGHYLEPAKENYSCGKAKEDWVLDNDILKPSELPALPLLFTFSTMDGSINVNENNCKMANIVPKRAKDTIKELNLDCQRLRNQRKKLLQSLEQEVRELGKEVLGKASEDLSDEEMEWLTAELVKEFFPVGKDGSIPEFFSTVRDFFGNHAEAILLQPPQDWI
jgi:uncharacterized protein (TIGR02646 family)